MDLLFDVKPEENYILLKVHGEIDLYNAKQLKDQVADASDDIDGPVNLILDLQDVKYIDSTGLGILIGIKRRCAEKEHHLVLLLDSQRIMNLFKITGLNNIFPIAESIEEAKTKFK